MLVSVVFSVESFVVEEELSELFCVQPAKNSKVAANPMLKNNFFAFIFLSFQVEIIVIYNDNKLWYEYLSFLPIKFSLNFLLEERCKPLKRFFYNVSGYKKKTQGDFIDGKLGISIYPERSTFEKDKAYLDLAHKYGFKRVFTSLLQIDGDKEQVLADFTKVVEYANSLGMEVMVDINPALFDQLEISYDDLSFFDKDGRLWYSLGRRIYWC